MKIKILISIVCSLFLLQCSEKLEEKQAKLGVKVNATEILKAISEATEGRKATDMQLGERVLYENNFVIEQGAVTRVQDFDTLIIHKAYDSENKKFNFMLKLKETTYRDGEFPEEKVWEEALVIPVVELPPIDPLKIVQKLSEDPIKKTFHDLKISKYKKNPPPRYIGSKGCEKLPDDCLLNVTLIEFEVASWFSETRWEKTLVEYEFTKDTPYLGNLLSSCTKGLLDYQGRYIFVSQCDVLRYFEFGEVPEKNAEE